MYKSLTSQTLHYFARPHTARPTGPLGGPAAWRGEALGDERRWSFDLSRAQSEEIEAALARVRASGKALGALAKRDFPLPTLARDIAAWRREVQGGLGFVRVRGLPVERWSREDSERFFFCLGHHLGTPGAQNVAGDLLGHVTDTGADPAARDVRRYRTAANIAYHCDAADAVGLLCLKKARRGGLSRIVSSVTVYDELVRRRPDLVPRLFEPFMLDTHGQSGLDFFPITPCRFSGGRLSTFYHSDYFRSAVAYERAPRHTARETELLDLYEAIANTDGLYLDMDLEPGDIQLISNHTILHARTAYEDFEEPSLRRHLLRLWLSFEPPASGVRASLGERARTLGSRAALVATLARFKAARLLRGPSARRESGARAP